MTAKKPESIQSLSSEIHTELDQALQVLGNRLTKVEGELDLECANLRDLVSERNPEVQKQIDALGQSISDLHFSLSDVRSKLQTARADSEELQEVTKLQVVPTDGFATSENKEAHILSPQQAGRMRHDEKITLGGIFRALFMADEPGQRFANMADPDTETKK